MVLCSPRQQLRHTNSRSVREFARHILTRIPPVFEASLFCMCYLDAHVARQHWNEIVDVLDETCDDWTVYPPLLLRSRAQLHLKFGNVHLYCFPSGPCVPVCPTDQRENERSVLFTLFTLHARERLDEHNAENLFHVAFADAREV